MALMAGIDSLKLIDAHYLPEPALVDQFLHLRIAGMISQRVTDADNPTALLPRLIDPPAVFKRDRHRLFEKHVIAASQCRDS